jgi:hypothetical protein
MQNLKTYSEINERLGIPEKNVELSLEVTDYVYKELDKNRDVKIKELDKNYIEGSFSYKMVFSRELKRKILSSFEEFYPKDNYPEFEDLGFSNLKYFLSIYFIFKPWNLDEIKFKKATPSSPPYLVKGGITKKTGLEGLYNKSYEEGIAIQMWCPKSKIDTLTIGDFLSHIRDKKDSFSALISHELKHIFDLNKMIISFREISVYESYMRTKFGIDAIDDFLNKLYLTHRLENLVRSSEFGSFLKSSNATKKNFLDIYNKSYLVGRIKEARNWSFDRMKKDLFSQIGFVRKKLKEDSIHPPEKDEECVDLIISLLKDNLLKSQKKKIKEKYGMFSYFVSGDPWEDLEDKFLKDIKKLGENKTPEKFFRDLQKTMNVNADKTLKKMAKLYDYVPDGESQIKENSKIINTEFHLDFKRTQSLIKKFKNFNHPRGI